MVSAPEKPQAADLDGLIGALASAVNQRNQRPGYRDVGYRHDPSGSPTTTGFVHGNGGSLSFPGVAQEVFHTAVGNRGILGQLPVRSSVETNPLYAIITGVTDDTGSEKTAVCDDAPVAGIIKTCYTTSVFGRYERQTPNIEINRLGTRNDRAEPLDLRMIGSPIQQTGLFLNSGPAAASAADILNNEVANRMWALSVSLHRLLSQQLWTGSPANNNGDAYKEITGLDLLINTGHTDALTNTACPSVDSLVTDFHYGNISSSGGDLVDVMTYQYRYVKDLAFRTGVSPVRWVWAMRPEVFQEITAVWPCAYLTYRCSFGDNDAARVLVDGNEQVRMRDEMRSGQYLLVDGERVEVVLDDGIPEVSQTQNGNVPPAAFSSSIFLVPMSILGGQAVTYLEYFDFGNPSISSARELAPNMFRVEGPWITTHKVRNWCIQLQTKIEPRLVLRTPWLAARLDHVVASPLIRMRQPFPENPYYVEGGVGTNRPGPSYYNLWS